MSKQKDDESVFVVADWVKDIIEITVKATPPNNDSATKR